MINVNELIIDDVGREVVYTCHEKREYGRITSWNGTFIFVLYHTVIYTDGKQRSRVGETSEATRPEDLEFV
jgi:hypothetical protein